MYRLAQLHFWGKNHTGLSHSKRLDTYLLDLHFDPIYCSEISSTGISALFYWVLTSSQHWHYPSPYFLKLSVFLIPASLPYYISGFFFSFSFRDSLPPLSLKSGVPRDPSVTGSSFCPSVLGYLILSYGLVSALYMLMIPECLSLTHSSVLSYRDVHTTISWTLQLGYVTATTNSMLSVSQTMFFLFHPFWLNNITCTKC